MSNVQCLTNKNLTLKISLGIGYCLPADEAGKLDIKENYAFLL